jgi:hypothetical protein
LQNSYDFVISRELEGVLGLLLHIGWSGGSCCHNTSANKGWTVNVIVDFAFNFSLGIDDLPFTSEPDHENASRVV